MPELALKNYKINKWVSSGNPSIEEDLVAVEEPLEILLIHNSELGVVETEVVLTMRSPGNDNELAVGFLFNEGIIKSYNEIKHIRYCVKTTESKKNKLRITLKDLIRVNTKVLKRNFTSTSSCGVCGKLVLEQLSIRFSKNELLKKISVETIVKLPGLLSSEQLLFKHTGGIHACALFTSNGSLISVKEDIGRHNALDKIIGKRLIEGNSFANTIIVLSGRVGYEMIQKAAIAGIPVVVAIGAPTSLAIDIAKKAGICMIGFAKNNSLNCYSNTEYIDFEK